MNLKQIESFVLVANLGSLSRAAVASDTAPSLISRHIAQLEEAWGDRLFERTGRGMSLSSFGQHMLEEARRVLDQIGELERIALDHAGLLSGVVRVGLIPSISRQLLPQLIAHLKTSAPAVRLHVTEGFSGQLDEQMSNGQLDMIVVNRYGVRAGRGEDVLGTVDTFLVGPPGHPLLKEETVEFRALARIPLVLPTRPNGLRVVLDQLAKRAGFKMEVIADVDAASLMVHVAASGTALTLLPLMAIQQEIAGSQLAVSRIRSPAIKRTIALSISTVSPPSKSAIHVAKVVKSIGKAILDGGTLVVK